MPAAGSRAPRLPATTARLCTECDTPVEGRAITCSDRCRSRRRERKKKGDTRIRPTTGGNPVQDDEVERQAREVIKEEIRPVIREAITADLLDSIRDLVGGLPAAIRAALQDLGDTRDTPDVRDRRQRAYTLIMRHSVGNTNLVPDINEGKQQELTVIFDLPKPAAAGEGGTETIETKECDACHNHKTLDQFVGSSNRCATCYAAMRELAEEVARG